MAAVLAERDIAAVYAKLGDLGMSQRRIAARTGQSQSEISEILAGRHVAAYNVLTRIGDGLGIPRGLLGLAHVSQPDPQRSNAAEKRAAVLRPCASCGTEPVVKRWTGLEIRLLREAMRLSVRRFADILGVSDRMVSKWEAAGHGICPRPHNQQALDILLSRTDADKRRRFYSLLTPANGEDDRS